MPVYARAPSKGNGGQPAAPQRGVAEQVRPKPAATPPPAPASAPAPDAQPYAPPPLPAGFAVRSRHRAILDSLYEAVFITDTKGTIVEVNARAEGITRLSREELLNQPVSAVVPTLSEEILCRAVAHLETTSHAVVEGWCLQDEGDRMRVEIAVSKLDSPREAELQMEHARHEGNFAGSLNILSMLDLLQLIASSNKTGTLEIMDAESRETSFASFEDGRMVCAACGETLGEPAVEKMIDKGGRLFRFRQDVIRHRDPSMTRATMSLVLDAVRILDEKKESGH
jgi:PAS domain S-box-containing protein